MNNFLKILLVAVIPFLILSFEQEELSEDEINEWFLTAEKYNGVKYEYGGNSFEGIDCSGYIIKMYNSIDCYIFKYENSYRTDVSAHVLYEYNTKHITFNELKKGDLIFYDADNDSIIDHVMLYDKTDSEGNIWVWDAVYKINETLINKVSYRKATEIFDKNPKYGRPLKVVITNRFFN